jgi:hypothetical protein
MRLLCVVWLALLSHSAVAQPQMRLASIEGMVVERDTGAPIADANVELRRVQRVPPQGLNPPPGVPFESFQRQTSGGTEQVALDSKVVVTALDGTFAIQNVPAGEYRLYATRPNGHAPAEYGQRSPVGSGVPFTIQEGQRMTAVSLVMTPTSAITGIVTDANGEPAGYAHVQALRAVYHDGRRSLTVMQLVQADDRGMFRLFWLPPGEYYVCAKMLDLRRSSEMMYIQPPSRFGTYEQQMRPTITAINTSRLQDDGSVAEGQYVPVYFPGTQDERRAAPIKVRAGQTVTGIDINLATSLVRTRRIRGRVIDGSTGNPTAASLQLIPQNPPAILLIPTGQAGQDGAFDMWGALPGADYLVASAGIGIGLLAIDIANADLNGVTVTVWPGAMVSGRIAVEGRSGTSQDPDVAGITVTLRRTPPVNGLPDAIQGRTEVVTRGFNGDFVVSRARDTGPGNTSDADGAFALRGVPPGDYTVILALKEDAYVESLRLGTRDLLETPMHVEGSVQGELDVVIRTNGGSIEGTAMNARREAAPNATVVAVPQGARRGRSDLFKVTSADASGRFRLRGLAPGSYQVFAWEEIESGAWRDPDVIQSLAGFARLISVDDGTRATVDVTLISDDR